MEILYYGIIAAQYAGDKRHPHYISKVLVVEVTKDGCRHPGKIYSKEQVIGLMKTNDVYTMIWDYEKDHWVKGAKVGFEKKDEQLFLRSNPNDVTKDNLSHLLDLDYFPIK